MRKIIAAKTHTLLSLPNQELVALANALNEVLHNSDISAEDCQTRVGLSLEELRRVQGELSAIVDASGTDAFEIFEAEKEGFSIQLRAISALGAPADLSYDTVFSKVGNLKDQAKDAWAPGKQ
jgi:hypothetical protein